MSTVRDTISFNIQDIGIESMDKLEELIRKFSALTGNMYHEPVIPKKEAQYPTYREIYNTIWSYDPNKFGQRLADILGHVRDEGGRYINFPEKVAFSRDICEYIGCIIKGTKKYTRPELVIKIQRALSRATAILITREGGTREAIEAAGEFCWLLAVGTDNDYKSILIDSTIGATGPHFFVAVILEGLKKGKILRQFYVRSIPDRHIDCFPIEGGAAVDMCMFLRYIIANKDRLERIKSVWDICFDLGLISTNGL